MYARRARIKAVANLPVRRKNDIGKSSQKSQKVESTLTQNKDPPSQPAVSGGTPDTNSVQDVQAVDVNSKLSNSIANPIEPTISQCGVALGKETNNDEITPLSKSISNELTESKECQLIQITEVPELQNNVTVSSDNTDSPNILNKVQNVENIDKPINDVGLTVINRTLNSEVAKSQNPPRRRITKPILINKRLSQTLKTPVINGNQGTENEVETPVNTDANKTKKEFNTDVNNIIKVFNTDANNTIKELNTDSNNAIKELNIDDSNTVKELNNFYNGFDTRPLNILNNNSLPEKENHNVVVGFPVVDDALIFNPPQPVAKNRPRIRPTPRLTPRRNSIQGSASESEDEGRHNHMSGGKSLFSHAATKSSRLPVSPKRRIRRTEAARKLAEARKIFSTKFGSNTPDRSQLTVFDMLYYNPSSNPMKKTDDPVIENVEGLTLEEAVDDPLLVPDPVTSAPPVQEEQYPQALPVPQIKIGPKGEIILDEQSLVIETTGTKKGREEIANSNLVFDDGNTNYGIYKKRRRPKDWTVSETLRFYKTLNTVGTDFSIMLSLFPGRSRRELKLKFKKEEKINMDLVDKALRNPQDFDMATLEEELKKDELNAKKKIELKKETDAKKRDESKKKTHPKIKAESKKKAECKKKSDNEQKAESKEHAETKEHTEPKEQTETKKRAKRKKQTDCNKPPKPKQEVDPMKHDLVKQLEEQRLLQFDFTNIPKIKRKRKKKKFYPKAARLINDVDDEEEEEEEIESVRDDADEIHNPPEQKIKVVIIKNSSFPVNPRMISSNIKCLDPMYRQPNNYIYTSTPKAGNIKKRTQGPDVKSETEPKRKKKCQAKSDGVLGLLADVAETRQRLEPNATDISKSANTNCTDRGNQNLHNHNLTDVDDYIKNCQSFTNVKERISCHGSEDGLSDLVVFEGLNLSEGPDTLLNISELVDGVDKGVLSLENDTAIPMSTDNTLVAMNVAENSNLPLISHVQTQEYFCMKTNSKSENVQVKDFVDPNNYNTTLQIAGNSNMILEYESPMSITDLSAVENPSQKSPEVSTMNSAEVCNNTDGSIVVLPFSETLEGMTMTFSDENGIPLNGSDNIMIFPFPSDLECGNFLCASQPHANNNLPSEGTKCEVSSEHDKYRVMHNGDIHESNGEQINKISCNSGQPKLDTGKQLENSICGSTLQQAVYQINGEHMENKKLGENIKSILDVHNNDTDMSHYSKIEESFTNTNFVQNENIKMNDSGNAGNKTDSNASLDIEMSMTVDHKAGTINKLDNSCKADTGEKKCNATNPLCNHPAVNDDSVVLGSLVLETKPSSIDPSVTIYNVLQKIMEGGKIIMKQINLPAEDLDLVIRNMLPLTEKQI